jgi:hypothetical protein
MQLESGVSLGSKLSFITISSPQEIKDSNNRYLVRSHALKDFHTKRKQQWVLQKAGLSYQQSSKKVAAKSDEIPVCSPESLSQRKCSCGDTYDPACSMPHQWHTPPVDLLGAGRVDPFSSYPHQLSYSEHLLVDYCKLYISPVAYADHLTPQS